MDKHDTLLIACGIPENRKVLRSVLEARFNLLEAANTQQTLLLLNQNLNCIAAIIMDVTVPEMLDMKLLERPETQKQMEQVPVIVISADDSANILNTAFSYGAADVIPLDYEPYAMLRRIETIVELHLHKQYLETMVEEQSNLLRHSNETMVDALSSIIEYRSVESGQHILRIRHFTKILLEEVARCCPEYQLNDTAIAIISSAAALHDIGKIAIPDSVLMKPGALTQEEREIMKSHAATGCRILDTLGDMGDPEYMRYAYNICRYHHERWDGGGYPEGLSGDDIPICAQVVGLADVYDALTTKRVYKEAFSFHRAVNMILKGECGAFSPKLLECFKHVTDAYEELARAYADGMSPKTESFDTALPAPAKQEENSLERIRAKYFALVHYINGLLIEVDLNRGLFHLIYNPYPELSWFQDVTTFSEMQQLLNDRTIAPESREKMMKFFYQDVPTFMEEDLRRSTHYFRFRSKVHPEGDTFEVTLLRINPIDANRRTLAVLCRRTSGENIPFQSEETVPIMSDSTFLCRNDEHFTLIQLGRHIPKLAGYSPEELKEIFRNRLTELVIPEDREKMRRDFQEQLTRGKAVETEFRVRHKDGHILWILDRSHLSVGADGREYLNSFLTDITESKKAYDALNDKLSRYEIILAQTENVLFEWDMENNTINYSETWEKIFGFHPMQENVREILTEGSYFHPDDLPLLIDGINNLENGSHYQMVEVRIATARGRYLWCRFRASAIRDENGRLQKIVGIIINIDAEKQAERLLQDRAERDSLTKLLNKNAARKQAEEYLARFPGGTDCALLVIDLDNFKQVNDQYGHLFGDAVLTKAAREIERQFRNQDIVARIGGDEFMVLMRGVSDSNLLEARCSRLIQSFQTIFRSQKHKLPLSCSIGVALSPEHGTSYFDLFNHADQALYRAKARGKNRFCFYREEDEQLPLQEARGMVKSTPIDSDEEPGLADNNIVQYAFRRLYASKNVEKSVNDILTLIGQKMNVSRVYVFENSDDNKFCSNTYEWCNEGIQPEIQNLQNISYETDIPGYADNFNEQGIFYCPDIAVLPKVTYDIVASQGIKSMLHCAIREGGVFRGYIGFDECVEQRFWTKEQIQTLRYFSEMLSVFLMKQRQQEKALSHANELRTVLDNQNAWIYIIDPDTCELKYLNAKTKKLAPNVRPGMRCHKALMGLEERCPGCPSRNIREEKNSSALIYSEHFDLKVLAEATLIQWDGEDSCLLTCRQLQDKKE